MKIATKTATDGMKFVHVSICHFCQLRPWYEYHASLFFSVVDFVTEDRVTTQRCRTHRCQYIFGELSVGNEECSYTHRLP